MVFLRQQIILFQTEFSRKYLFHTNEYSLETEKMYFLL